MHKVVVVGVLAFGLGCSGDDGPARCASADYECYLDHLVVTENGQTLTLDKVASIPMPMGGGGMSPSGVIWAVGANGAIRRWTGQWQSLNGVPIPSVTFMGVHGSSESNVWLVGAGGTTSRWNGSMLETMSGIGATVNVDDVFVMDSTTVRAVGSPGDGTGRYCLWNGSWGCSANGYPILRALWMNTNETYLTGGQASGYSAHVSSGGNVLPVSSSIVGYDVWSASGNEAWVAGAGLQHITNGTTATDVVVPGATLTLRAITGIGSTHLWVSEDYVGVHHYVSGTWTKFDLPFRVFGLWAHSPTDVWAVGEGGGTAHWDGTAWTMRASNTTETLYDVWGSGASAPPGGGGGGGGTAPYFTGSLGPALTFTPSMPMQSVTLPWADPTAACRPAFCFSACSPTGRCFAPARCTRSIPDGLTSGTTTLGVKYTAVPSGTTNEAFDLWITPISMPDCSQPAKNGAIDPGALVGGGDKVPQIIEPPMQGGGGSCGITGSECVTADACCNDMEREDRGDQDVLCSCKVPVGDPCYSAFGSIIIGERICCNGLGGDSAVGTASSACLNGVVCPGASDVECPLGSTCQFFGGEYQCFAVCMPVGNEPGSGYPCCAGLVTTAADPRCHFPVGHFCNDNSDCARPPANSPPIWSMCVPQSDGTARCDATGARL